MFKGKSLEETKVGEFDAIIRVTGGAYITGFNHFVIDPEDPLSMDLQYKIVYNR